MAARVEHDELQDCRLQLAQALEDLGKSQLETESCRVEIGRLRSLLEG